MAELKSSLKQGSKDKHIGFAENTKDSKEEEENAPNGPQPLKRFGSSRDLTKGKKNNYDS